MSQPTREALRSHRQVFWDTWQKALADLPLNALEVRIARVIKLHPEYHHFFDDMEDFLDRDFQDNGGMNPYLHMSLHLALEEQIATHQPPEAAQAVEYLMQNKAMDRHDALHTILEILVELLHTAQQRQVEPDHAEYANKIKGLMLS